MNNKLYTFIYYPNLLDYVEVFEAKKCWNLEALL